MNTNRILFRSAAVGFPPQKIASSLKTEEWANQCMDAIIGKASLLNQQGGRRTNRNDKIRNYNLINSILDANDFQSVVSSLGYATEEHIANDPAKLRPFNMFFPIHQQLIGEDLKRPFPFTVYATSGSIVEEKSKEKQEAVVSELLKGFRQKVKRTANPNLEEEDVNLDQVAKDYGSSYYHKKEILANKYMKSLYKTCELDITFRDGLSHAIIVAEELYKVTRINGQPNVRVVDPLQIDFDLPTGSSKLEDAYWVREERHLSLAEIIDEFAEDLTDAQITELENSGSFYNRGYSPTTDFPGVLSEDLNHNSIERYGSAQGRTVGNITTYDVNNVCWKSFQKTPYLEGIDDSGKEFKILVDEKRKLTPEEKKKGYSIKVLWVTQVWEGVKIGPLYLKASPTEVRYSSMSNPKAAKLPYVGTVYNALNSLATSIVDLIRPLNYLKIIIIYRLEKELAKAKGKKIVIDKAKIPGDMSWDEWFYYLNEQDVEFIDTSKVGSGSPNLAYNTYKDHDLTISSNATQYLGIIQYIDAEIFRITGMNSTRMGTPTADGLGVNQMAMTQSYAITENLFYQHNDVKKRVLSHLLLLAKYCYSDTENVKFQQMNGDLLTEIIEMDGGIFADSDFDIFVVNSIKENKIFATIESLAASAMQQQAVTMSEFVKALRSESASEMEAILAKAEERRRQQDQDFKQKSLELQKEQNQIAQAKMQSDKEERQLDRDTNIRIAEIRSGTDIEKANLALDNNSENEANRAFALDSAKTQSDNRKINVDAALKIAELKTKVYDADTKLKIAKENKFPGEK
ncbi:MAG: hypothetical protein EBU90_01540 [Proteobacteria bacterium]|nr:hypothetical protein [Pseudomonadota bacterium]